MANEYVPHNWDDEDMCFLDDGECYECGGEGFIVADCFEDTCCCADPEEHGLIPCPVCSKAATSTKGTGK